MVAGYVVAMALGMVNYGKIASRWLVCSSNASSIWNRFCSWGAIILMLFMSIVTTIETIGDISATTMGGANREATDKEISGGIMADGAWYNFWSYI